MPNAKAKMSYTRRFERTRDKWRLAAKMAGEEFESSASKRSEIKSSVNVDQLIVSLNDGDEDAVDSLLRKYRPYLRVVAQKATRKMFSAKFDTSDAVQQTCLEAFDSIESFRGKTEAEFHGWITTILRNNVLNLIRAYTAQKRDVRREYSLQLDQHEVSLEWHVLDCGSGPESKTLRGEAAFVLAETLSLLTDAQRTAVQMRFLEGAKLSEIASHMDIKTPSVAKLIERGIDALRRHLPNDLGELT